MFHQITGGADGSIRATSLAALQVGGAGKMDHTTAGWEVWLPEKRKPQSLVLTDDITALVLTTTGLVYLFIIVPHVMSSSSI